MTFDFFNAVDAINFITVNTLGDETDADLGVGDISLREAVSIANSTELPDIIFFADALQGQTIQLSRGALAVDGAILFEGDINGDDQPDITLDANFGDRIFNLQGPNVAINGLTLINGQAEDNGGAIDAKADFDIANSVIRDSFAFGNGGGIAVEGAAVKILNTNLSTNLGTQGGGLHIGAGSSVFVADSTFSQNQAFTLGGGIYNAGTLNLFNSGLDANQAEESGGGLFNRGEARVENTILSANFGRTSGGGITNGEFEEPGVLNVVASQIENNSADLIGGGINNANGTLNVTDSTISGNIVDFDGGGISGSGTIVNSTIVQNSAYEYGGGLSGNFTITNSAISQNTASFGGGLVGGGTITNSLVNGNSAQLNGAGILGEDLAITNSTISDNTLDSEFFKGAGVHAAGSIQLTNSIISGNTGGDDVSVAEAGEIQINGVNLVEDGSFQGVSVLNLDPQLGEVTDNGGTVPSQSLLPESPAIDAGDNSFVTSEFDQRGEGFSRILDGNGDGQATVDLGAVESAAIESIENLYFTLKKAAVLQGIEVENEDIILKDSQGFSKVFDGSDVGLANRKVNAFDFIGDDQILMSFDHPTVLEGLGEVDDSDIVKFTATSLGEQTSGTFELYFDGSDVGLDQREEDIDALTGLANGDIIVSTKASVLVPGVEAGREDILRFTPTSLGENTSGTWSQEFDMSDVGLERTNIDGLHVKESGEIFLSTSGQFNAGGEIRANDDVFKFSPTTHGEDTTGSFSASLFDGSAFGLLGNSIGALDMV